MGADDFASDSAYRPPIAPVSPPNSTDVESVPPPEEVRPRRLRSMGRGAKIGFRYTSYVAGTLAALVAVSSLALTAFGLGSGRGFGIHPSLLGALGFYLSATFWGILIGALAGLILGLLPSPRPGSRLGSWWGRMSRTSTDRRSIGVDPARSRSRRWPWVVGSLLSLVLMIAWAVGIYVGSNVDRRLATAIDAADRDDPNWRVDDLLAAREPVPDDENSAIVVAEVVAMLPEDWPAGPKAPGGVASPPTDISKAYDRLIATPADVRLDDATADTLRTELGEYEEAVELARTVADYDHGRHELELGPTFFHTQLPETQAARTAARLLATDTAIRAHEGDFDGAIDSCRAVLGVARSIGDEPFLISQIVRAAIGNMAMKSAQRTLGQGEPSEEALSRIQALVLDELDQPLLFHGLSGERAMQYELIDRIEAGEVPISVIGGGGPPFEPGARRQAIAPWGKLMFDNQRAISLEWLNAAVDIAKRPTEEQIPLWKEWQAEIDRTRRTLQAPYTATIPVLMSPAIGASASAQAFYRSELGAMATLLAAERHRRKAGSWPASIDAIDRTLLPSPPLDPYSGKPFLMERRDGEILIHSVGPNGQDEHGAYEPKKWNQGGPDDVGFAAWDVPRRAKPSPP